MATNEGTGEASGGSEDASATADNEREIGSVNYRCNKLGFSVGLPLLKRLLEIAAPVMAAGLRGGRLPERLANVLDTLPTAFTLKDLQTFAQAFGNVSYYMADDGRWVLLVNNGKLNAQETHFTGRYAEFVQWLVFCIEVNFAGFFAGAMSETNEKAAENSNLFGNLMAILKGQAKSSSSDTGTSSNTA